jgi:hypothetical protein
MAERHIIRCTCGAWRHARLTCITCQKLTSRYTNATEAAGAAGSPCRGGRPRLQAAEIS